MQSNSTPLSTSCWHALPCRQYRQRRTGGYRNNSTVVQALETATRAGGNRRSALAGGESETDTSSPTSREGKRGDGVGAKMLRRGGTNWSWSMRNKEQPPLCHSPTQPPTHYPLLSTIRLGIPHLAPDSRQPKPATASVPERLNMTAV
jgi:hypothetical protein